MSEYNAVPPPVPGAPLPGQAAVGNGAGGAKKDAFADAVQRARQVRPTSTTEEYSVPDSMVGLIIGRGGEQINKIQQESGCKVQIAPGTGCTRRLQILILAPPLVRKAKRLLNEIVSRGRGTPPLSSYHDSSNGQNGAVHEMMIPAGKAGLVIGKGGETIKQLQERAGVKMILIQDASQGPNVDKPLRIIGDPYKVQQAQEMVQEILRDRDQGGYSERSEFSSRMGGGMDVIPRHSVGVVIGRNGEMIKKIQNDAGVRIQFKQDDGTGPDKIAHISGPPERCEHAAQIINDLLQSIRGPPGPPGMRLGSPGGEMTFSIPAQKCGLVIGRGGENVKSINQQTGAFVEISRQPPPNGDPNFKLFIIRGSPQQIDHAKQLIEEKIEVLGPLCPVGPGTAGPGPAGPMVPYSPNPYNPGPPGAPGPPQPVAGAHPHPMRTSPLHPASFLGKAAANDPNAAWAAYYAQYYQQPSGAAPAPYPANQAGGAQAPDYTKAWEEYYKKMGTSRRLYTRAAWAEYYRQQAAYYGQTGQQPSGQPAQSYLEQTKIQKTLPLNIFFFLILFCT
uniref:KH-type splicing regulatory protein n=1 Tax=Maylandia zebra TaxID=106582 RepID=A0A3P9DA41_9CICH